MPRFVVVTGIGAAPEVCFDLSRSIDVHVESMAASHERAVAGVTSGLIGAGEEVSWEARHFGRLWRMTSRISEYEPPHRFVDEMVTGPFRSYRHEHRFEADGGATRMVDDVQVDMGWGPLRPVANAIAAVYLERLIRQRNETIKSKAEGG